MEIGLNDDIFLSIFDFYRLDEENAWNVRLGWCKLSHVCHRWRHLIHESATHLGLHILCTNGTPIVDTLDHLPPLPIFVNYQFTDVTIWEQDELGILHALQLRDRVRSVDLDLPPSILHKYLMLLEGHFPILEHLSLSVTVDVDKTVITTLILPKTFLAPNLLYRLVLFGVSLPKRLRLLSSIVSLVTLELGIIRASGYFSPKLLVARFESLHRLEELFICFSIPIPRPSAERELLSKQGTPVTLPSLKILKFQGVSAYLECLVAQIRAPLLERLHIALFNQIAFTLPLLSQFAITERIKFEFARVNFGRDAVSIIVDHRTERNGELFDDGNFTLRVICKPLDWQIDCAAQVCSALIPVLSGIEDLALDYHERVMPTEWQNGGIDHTTWHGLLRPFIRVKRLHIYGSLSEELSRALQVGEIGSDPGFLPGLLELKSFFETRLADSLFDSFIQARRVAGCPVKRYLVDKNHVGVVVLHIYNANDLPKWSNVTRSGWDMDPFVKVSIGEQVKKTEVQRHELNPVWDKELLFQLGQQDLKLPIRLEILDWDRFSRDDLVGSAEIKVATLVERAANRDPNTGLHPVDFPPVLYFNGFPLTKNPDSSRAYTRTPTITFHASYQSY